MCFSGGLQPSGLPMERETNARMEAVEPKKRTIVDIYGEHGFTLFAP
jgi:hypothetical protein